MPSKFCLDCRTVFKIEPGVSASRCPPCQAALMSRINARPKGNTTQRGLGAAHQRKARVLLSQPGLVCVRCGLPGTEQDPLTAGHSEDRSRGGADSALQPEHRSCGSRAGAQLRRGEKRS